MSGADLSSFARRFVHGTTIPEIHYDYHVEESGDGKWVVRGTARVVDESSYHCRLVRTDRETWDVVHRRSRTPDVADLALVVPFQVTLAASLTEQARRERRLAGFVTDRGLGGDLLLQGRETPFAVPLEEKPAVFWLDQRGEVLASFYNETRAPKRVLLYKAMDLESDEAQPLLQRALALPLVSEEARREEGWSEKETRQRTELEDARIHLELARVHLDRGADDAARESIAAAEKLLRGADAWRWGATRDALACRLSVRAGDYKTAWSRLEGRIRLELPRGDSIGDEMRRSKWQRGYVGDGDDYALLAIVAFETGKEEIARAAAEEAEERGADLAELRRLLPADR
jgi:hypothetical protein